MGTSIHKEISGENGTPDKSGSPMKFLGLGGGQFDAARASSAGGLGGGLTGKKVLKGLLNPVGTIANKMGMGDTGLGKMLNPGDAIKNKFF